MDTSLHDDDIDPRLTELAQSYHVPPATPREQLWDRIAASRGIQPVVTVRPLRRRLAPYAIAAGVAALVLAAYSFGRMSGHAAPAPVAALAVTTPKRGGSVAEQIAATEYLGRVEYFLTDFRTAARKGASSSIPAADARRLLTATRLLLDSPGGQDPRLRPLLEDLELVLAAITQLPGGTPDDLNLITEGLDRGGTLSRLRSAVPAGHPPVSARRTTHEPDLHGTRRRRLAGLERRPPA